MTSPKHKLRFKAMNHRLGFEPDTIITADELRPGYTAEQLVHMGHLSVVETAKGTSKTTIKGESPDKEGA